MFSTADSIVAIATAPEGAGRAIIRASGGGLAQIVGRVFEADADEGAAWKGPPRVVEGRICFDSLRIPAELWLWPGRRSYTREPSAEVHTIGSPPLAETVVDAFCQAGARLAQPGEFTLRAFLAGRIDLPQAEAVLAVIDSSNRRQLDLALRQLAGGLSCRIASISDFLLNLLADLEAGLDFVEDDIRFVSPNELCDRINHARQEVGQIAEQLVARESQTPLFSATFVGRPNVGKSSLFNALTKSPAALVSSHPGATRDYLKATLALDGLSIELIDTAGLDSWQSAEPILKAAQTVAAEQHDRATVRLLCIDSTTEPSDWELEQSGNENTITVLTKCDQQTAMRRWPLASHAIETSSVTGRGMDALTSAIRERLLEQPNEGAALGTTAARARANIGAAVAALERAHQLAAEANAEELVAVEIRAAWNELGTIVGATYAEDLLDRIFSRFCIGK